MDIKPQIDYSLTGATIHFKKWKNKVDGMKFYLNKSQNVEQEIEKIVKDLKGKKGYKRRKIIGVSIFYPLNISL